MSRGLGAIQRRVVEVLGETSPDSRPLAEVRGLVGTDKSNLRRAVRGLIVRKLVEQTRGDRGELRLKLTFRGFLVAVCELARRYPRDFTDDL